MSELLLVVKDAAEQGAEAAMAKSKAAWAWALGIQRKPKVPNGDSN